MGPWQGSRKSARPCAHFRNTLWVFAEPFAFSEQDRIEGGEQRWRTIGVVEGHILLTVAHTIRDEDGDGQPLEVTRIISAHIADPTERKRYEQENR